MKLVVIIPCRNEEQDIGGTIRAIPRDIPHFSEVEVLVVDDGSSDSSIAKAREAGADHVVELGRHRGLSEAFRRGMESALGIGADVAVVLDADGQYPPEEVGLLALPVAQGKADIALGVRPIWNHPDFSPIKRVLQRMGSKVVSLLCRQPIQDAVTGFRAYDREAMLRLLVLNEYTYTVETLIQASYEGLRITHVDINVRPTTRPSRLVRSIPSYIGRMLGIMFRVTLRYFPLKVFSLFAICFLLPGLALGTRFLVFYVQGQGQGHMQSLLLCTLLILISIHTMGLGLLADLIATNRRLLQEVLIANKKLEPIAGADGRSTSTPPPTPEACALEAR